MDLRSLLNVVYAAFAQAAEDVEELDAELEAEPPLVGEAAARPGRSKGLDKVMAAMRLPQMGAGAGRAS